MCYFDSGFGSFCIGGGTCFRNLPRFRTDDHSRWHRFFVRFDGSHHVHSVSAHDICHRFTGLQGLDGVIMILPQVHLRKPCYDFTFL